MTTPDISDLTPRLEGPTTRQREPLDIGLDPATIVAFEELCQQVGLPVETLLSCLQVHYEKERGHPSLW